jgi:uncharacterized protein YgbK (DUF1537 family)
MFSFRRVGVLADDFSGAGDVALAFRSAGLASEIGAPVNGRFLVLPLPRTRVWIIDTESRGLAPRAADRAVRNALATLAHWKPDFIFKKIDSTLRGPVGAELAAFVHILQPDGPVAFVPAFPKMKRTTVAGRHFVQGIPLHRTAFGKDPRAPVRTNVISKILAQTYKKGFLQEKVSNAPNSVLARSWSLGFQQQNVPTRERVWVPDVETDRQMAGVARRVLRTGRVAVGSAGFAAALAREMVGGHPPGRDPKPVFPMTRAKRGVGVVVGSAHPVSREQLDRLKNFFPAKGVFLFEGPFQRGTPGQVLRRLVRKARKMETVQGIRRWVVTGGETAFAMARVWKSFRWQVVGAIEPGVPLCRSLGRPARWLVMKPGGFGSTDVLLESVRQLLGKGG